MDYWMKLRGMVGRDPLLIPAAGIILYRDGKVLLQRRSDKGTWAIHGGGMNPGETTEETARRELFEEVGLTAGSLELYGIFSGEELHCFYPGGDEAYVVSAVYFCDTFTGDIKLDPNEVAEARWFDYDKLPENINEPVDRVILRGLKRYIERKYGE